MESPNSSSPLTLHDLAKPSSVSKSFAATSSPLLSSSSLSPNLLYVRRKLTPSPRDLPLNSSLMGVVSSSTYLQAGLEKGDNCVMVCLCWKVTTILSLSFYQVSVILYLFHLLFVSLASLCSCSHLSFLVHQTRLVWGIKLCVSIFVRIGFVLCL